MASITLNNSNACEADTQVSLLSHMFIKVHKDRKEWESFDNVGFHYREGEEYLPCIMNNCVTVNENNSSMKKLSISLVEFP